MAVTTKRQHRDSLRELIRANPGLDSKKLLELAQKKGIKTTFMQVVGVRTIMRDRSEVRDGVGNCHASSNKAHATADGTKTEGNGVSAGYEPVNRLTPLMPSPKQHIALSLSEINTLGDIARRVGSWQALSEIVKSFAL